ATAPRIASKQGADSSMTCALMQALMRPSPGGTPAQSRSISEPQAFASVMASCAIDTAGISASAAATIRPSLFVMASPPSVCYPNSRFSLLVLKHQDAPERECHMADGPGPERDAGKPDGAGKASPWTDRVALGDPKAPLTC